MKDDLFQIKFGRVLLVLTREEFRKALKRGRSVKKNRRLAEKRRGIHLQGKQAK